MTSEVPNIDPVVINEVQLLLAEKRTSLSVLRTGIAVLALPLSVVSVLIATSKYYDLSKVLHFIVPLSIFNFVLILLGSYLIVESIMKMKAYDDHIRHLKSKCSAISELIE